MKKWNLVNGVLLAILGLLIIIFPNFWLKVVIILLGLGAIVYGIYNFKITKALSDTPVYNRTILIRGIVSIVIGICAIFFPLAFGETLWAVIIWVLVIYLVISAGLGFYAAALLRNSGLNRKKYIFENILLLFIAIALILISPSKLGNTIIRIIGIVALVIGLGIIVFSILSKKNGATENTYVSYEVKDDKVEDQKDSTVSDDEKAKDDND